MKALVCLLLTQKLLLSDQACTGRGSFPTGGPLAEGAAGESRQRAAINGP